MLSLSSLILSCDDGHGPGKGLSGSIEYTVSGGWAGGIHTKLSIDRAAHVVLQSTSPPLKGDLPESEQAKLENLFVDIWNHPDTIFFGCVDVPTFEIKWTDIRGTKTVVVDGCSLYPPGGETKYPVLSEIVDVLAAVAVRISRP